MTHQQFWNLIEKSKRGSEGEPDLQAENLTALLAKLDEDEIVDFERVFGHYHTLSYTSELWAAAYIVNDGCSDDGFDYFRAWLIGKGEKIFKTVLENPEMLRKYVSIDQAEDGLENESLMYASAEAYEEKTGKSQEEFFEKIGQEKSLPEIEISWTEENVHSLFPKLSKKFSG